MTAFSLVNSAHTLYRSTAQLIINIFSFPGMKSCAHSFIYGMCAFIYITRTKSGKRSHTVSKIRLFSSVHCAKAAFAFRNKHSICSSFAVLGFSLQFLCIHRFKVKNKNYLIVINIIGMRGFFGGDFSLNT